MFPGSCASEISFRTARGLAPALLAASLCVLVLDATWAGAAEVPLGSQTVISSTNLGQREIALADIDRDGDLDILSTSATDDTLAWYANSGSGSFGARQVISTAGDGVWRVDAADLDGDGDLDVLAVSGLDDEVAWYANNGSGSFGSQNVISTTGSEPTDAIAADIDKDGDLDVVVSSNNDDAVRWFQNDGGSPPSFLTVSTTTISTTADGAQAVFAADLDGDGDLDVLSASANDDRIVWYRNTDGAGTFSSGSNISASQNGPVFVSAADVDGDGDLDVVAASRGDDTIAWYENTDGSGTFGTAQVITDTADFAQWALPVDLDRDGDVDVLAASDLDDRIAWFDNTAGDGSAWMEYGISVTADGALRALAGDLDKDGDLDVLSASVGDNKIASYENLNIHRSAAFTQRHVISSSEDGATELAVADLDHDGDLDVVSLSTNDTALRWHENASGDGSTWVRRTITATAAGAYVCAADVDQDGDIDLVSNNGTDAVWFENDGASPPGWSVNSTIGLGGGAASDCALARLDRDADPDVLAAASLSDRVVWFSNTDGLGSFGSQNDITTTAGGAISVAAADINRDGNMDVVYAARDDDEILWAENDGGTTPGFMTMTTVASGTVDADGARCVVTADLDLNGTPDVVSGSQDNDKVSWHFNANGIGTSWLTSTVSSSAANVQSVATSDLDQDGDPDTLSASPDDDKVAWYSNIRQFYPGAEIVISNAAGTAPRSVVTGDVDGDGDDDVVAALSGTDEVVWFENSGGQYAFVTTDTAPAALVDGGFHSLLTITLTHTGQVGDSDVELAALELLFEESPGDPLTSAEANALIDALGLYLDAGSPGFNPNEDVPVAVIDPLPLTNGVLSYTCTDGDPNLQVSPGTSKTFYVVVLMTSNASSQTPSTFQVTHLTESSSRVEDAATDITLGGEFVANAGTPPTDAEPATSRVTVSGTANGGSLDFVVNGVQLSVTTTPGQTAQEVAQAMADAINANATLQGMGIAGTVDGLQVEKMVTNGSVTTVIVKDNGITIDAQTVPALSVPGAALFLALLGLAAALQRRRSATLAR